VNPFARILFIRRDWKKRNNAARSPEPLIIVLTATCLYTQPHSPPPPPRSPRRLLPLYPRPLPDTLSPGIIGLVFTRLPVSFRIERPGKPQADTALQNGASSDTRFSSVNTDRIGSLRTQSVLSLKAPRSVFSVDRRGQPAVCCFSSSDRDRENAPDRFLPFSLENALTFQTRDRLGIGDWNFPSFLKYLTFVFISLARSMPPRSCRTNDARRYGFG